MNHNSIKLVLMHLADLGPAKSREIAENLKLKPKHASMVLSRCKRRGFVSRQRFKRGRVHGYIYDINDKGVEWLLYKASQQRNTNLLESKPTTRAGNKSTCLPSFKMLNLSQTHQSSTDFNLINMGLVAREMQTTNAKYEKLKQLYDLAILTLIKVSSERDFLFSISQMEHEEKLQILKKSHSQDRKCLPESFCSEWLQGFECALELGLKLGKLIGETRMLARTQAAVTKIILKNKS